MDQNTQQTPPAGNTQGEASQGDPKDVEENKIWGAIGYLGILSIVVLLMKKDSEFARFHAKQGFVLFIGMFLAVIPFIGWILGLVVMILAIMGIINAATGKKWKLPILGDLAAKINF